MTFPELMMNTGFGSVLLLGAGVWIVCALLFGKADKE